jgi:hypothetical protein
VLRLVIKKTIILILLTTNYWNYYEYKALIIYYLVLQDSQLVHTKHTKIRNLRYIFKIPRGRVSHLKLISVIIS